jgi:predicted anti-sigma-YlaC factor YlaD
MENANHIAEDNLYLFALQLLPDAEMKEIALHLKDCHECRAQLGEIQGALVAYAMTAEMKTPPTEARERLLRQVGLEKKIVPIDSVEKRAEPVKKPIETKPMEVAEKTVAEKPVELKAVEPVEKPIEMKPVERTEAPVERTSVQRMERPAEPVDRHQEPVLYPRNSRMFQMDSPEERKRGRVAPILAWTGWAVAALAAVAAGVQYQQQKLLQDNLAAETAQLNENTAQTAGAKKVLQTLTDANAMQVSLHVPLTKGAQPKIDPEAHATYVPGKGALVFVASHLDPLLPAKTYELWLLPADPSQSPIPAGLFKPDLKGNATLVMPELPKGVSAKGFGVTVENEGGSKTPTAPIVLAGM